MNVTTAGTDPKSPQKIPNEVEILRVSTKTW